MKRSLQHRLSMMLVWTVLVGGALASLVAFYFAYSEAQDIQDDNLRQVAALGGGHRLQIQRLHAADRRLQDPEQRIRVMLLPQGRRPAWLPADLAAGFHTLPGRGSEGEMRVFVQLLSDQSRVVVAQSTESRNEIAYNSGLRTLLPLLLLLPILIGLIRFIVRKELNPVRRLAANLDRRTAQQLQQLPTGDVPEEIAPFVEAINRLLERVDRMVSEQRRFIADAAHELRSPLTALSLQSRNLAQAATVEACRERLQPLQAGIERASRLTVQLLDLARLQAGKSGSSAVDVSHMARELVAELLPLAEAKGLDLGLALDEAVQLNTDPAALRLILRNGLENAVKYAPVGGEVTVRLSRADGSTTIQVIDSGPGIPDEEIDRVFQAFHRAAPTGEGSGLGLAIAREATLQLGGQLTISNRKDRAGLVYCLLLPDQPVGQ